MDPAFASDPAMEGAISVELLRKALQNPGSGEILGAFEQGSLIGIIGLGRNEVDHTGTLFGLYVVPGLRGSGYGRALVRALIKRASNGRELSTVELLVDISNTIAKALYETEGFAAEADSGQSTLRMRLCF